MMMMRRQIGAKAYRLDGSVGFSTPPKRLKNYKGTEFLSMSRGVARFYRCLAASIDFIDVSRRR